MIEVEVRHFLNTLDSRRDATGTQLVTLRFRSASLNKETEPMTKLMASLALTGVMAAGLSMPASARDDDRRQHCQMVKKCTWEHGHKHCKSVRVCDRSHGDRH